MAKGYKNIYVVFDGVKDVEFSTRPAARYYANEVCGDPKYYRVVKRRIDTDIVVAGPDGQKAILKRNGKEYSLAYNGRVRFGNKAEITADKRFFEEHGILPERKVGWF